MVVGRVKIACGQYSTLFLTELKTTSGGEAVNSGDLSRDIFNVCGTSSYVVCVGKSTKIEPVDAQAESLLSEV